jgi:hypothetical protein
MSKAERKNYMEWSSRKNLLAEKHVEILTFQGGQDILYIIF